VSRTRWLYGLILAGAMCTATLPAVPAHAAQSALAAQSAPALGNPSPPPAPPGGKIYGPYKDKNSDPNGSYCNSILRNFYKQGAVPPGWQATCYLHDDGYWYLVLWPQAEQQPSSQTIQAGSFLISAAITLMMQADGNLVVYQIGTHRPLWASHTVGLGGTYARMQTDGNLVIYKPGNASVWSTRTCCHSNAWLAIQDDGNVVIYTSGGAASAKPGSAAPKLPTRSGTVLWAAGS
jgi:hypothetical protein